MMEMYEFGHKGVDPKPQLKTPWDAISEYNDLQRSVENIVHYAKVNGRADHFVRDLDILMHCCRETMFHAMVIREAMTGKKVAHEDPQDNARRMASVHQPLFVFDERSVGPLEKENCMPVELRDPDTGESKTIWIPKKEVFSKR